MISLLNDHYKGINNHIIIPEKPYLYDINDLINYMKGKGTRDDIIAFLGTSTYLFLYFF